MTDSPLTKIQNANQNYFGYTDSQLRMVNFMYWYCHLLEKQLKKLLLALIEGATQIKKEHEGPLRKLLDVVFEEATLTAKIKTLKAVVDPNTVDGFKEFLGLHDKAIGWRNDIAHMKIESLKYEGQDMIEEATQEKMLQDLIDILTRVTKK